MARMTLEEVREAAYKAWQGLHHNASLRGAFPDVQNSFEDELFWSVLGEETSCWIRDLQEDIKERWGFELTFYQYGRSGATIAPDEWMTAAPCGSFGSLKSEVLEPGYGIAGLEEYNHACAVLKCLEYIRTYWEAQAADIPGWWERMKEANEWADLINAHENAEKRPRWVDKETGELVNA